MARYRTKDTVDLDWNKIRRWITMVVDVGFRDAREEVLNTLLSEAWHQYSAALDVGKKLELEHGDMEFIRAKVAKALEGVELRLTDEAA